MAAIVATWVGGPFDGQQVAVETDLLRFVMKDNIWADPVEYTVQVRRVLGGFRLFWWDRAPSR